MTKPIEMQQNQTNLKNLPFFLYIPSISFYSARDLLAILVINMYMIAALLTKGDAFVKLFFL